MDERIAEIEQELARKERLLAKVPADAVSSLRREDERAIAMLRDELAFARAQREAAAAGKTWNGRAFRWARRDGKSVDEAIAAALA